MWFRIIGHGSGHYNSSILGIHQHLHKFVLLRLAGDLTEPGHHVFQGVDWFIAQLDVLVGWDDPDLCSYQESQRSMGPWHGVEKI